MIKKYLAIVALVLAFIFMAGTRANAGNIYSKQIVDNHHIIYYCNNQRWDCYQYWQNIPTGLGADWCDNLAELYFHAPDGCFEDHPKAPFDISLAILISLGALAAFRKRFI